MIKCNNSVTFVASVTQLRKIEMNIGNFCRAQILAGKTNAEILNLVAIQFPTAKTTAACIAWYKSDMRKHGLLEKKQVESKKMTVEERKAWLLAELAKIEA